MMLREWQCFRFQGLNGFSVYFLGTCQPCMCICLLVRFFCFLLFKLYRNKDLGESQVIIPGHILDDNTGWIEFSFIRFLMQMPNIVSNIFIIYLTYFKLICIPIIKLVL